MALRALAPSFASPLLLLRPPKNVTARVCFFAVWVGAQLLHTLGGPLLLRWRLLPRRRRVPIPFAQSILAAVIVLSEVGRLAVLANRGERALVAVAVPVSAALWVYLFLLPPPHHCYNYYYALLLLLRRARLVAEATGIVLWLLVALWLLVVSKPVVVGVAPPSPSSTASSLQWPRLLLILDWLCAYTSSSSSFSRRRQHHHHYRQPVAVRLFFFVACTLILAAVLARPDVAPHLAQPWALWWALPALTLGTHAALAAPLLLLLRLGAPSPQPRPTAAVWRLYWVAGITAFALCANQEEAEDSSSSSRGGKEEPFLLSLWLLGLHAAVRWLAYLNRCWCYYYY
jgi:hypothetical protein